MQHSKSKRPVSSKLPFRQSSFEPGASTKNGHWHIPSADDARARGVAEAIWGQSLGLQTLHPTHGIGLLPPNHALPRKERGIFERRPPPRTRDFAGTTAELGRCAPRFAIVGANFAILEGKSRGVPRRLPTRLGFEAPQEHRERYAALKLEAVRRHSIFAYVVSN
jgi:hypothetical protein